MKKHSLLFLLSMLVFSACSDNYSDYLVLSKTKNQEKPNVLADITNYIKSTNAGRTRASSLTIEPYIYKGDTVMYIANYGNGWDLFSNNHHVPMIMASAESGSFDTTTMSVPAKEYIENIANELHQVHKTSKESGMTYGLWNSVYVQNDEVDMADVTIAPQAEGTMPSENGYWVLIDRKNTAQYSNQIDHLTTTKWFQGSPFNSYIPYNFRLKIMTGYTMQLAAVLLP